MQAGNTDAALETLRKITGQGFRSYVAELKGDILLGQHKVDEAREAYQAAAAAAEGGEVQPVLQMKITDLAKPEAAPEAVPKRRDGTQHRQRHRRPMRLHRNLCALVGIALLSSGCSWFSWLPWADKSTDPDAPAELTSYKAEVKIERLWGGSVGQGLGKQYVRLPPGVLADRAFAADGFGYVEARERFKGKKLWTARIGEDEKGFFCEPESARSPRHQLRHRRRWRRRRSRHLGHHARGSGRAVGR